MMTEEHAHLLEDHDVLVYENTLTDWDVGCVLAINSVFYAHTRFVPALLVYTLVVCSISLETSECQGLSVAIMMAMFFDVLLLRFNLRVPHRYHTFRSVVHGFAGLNHATKLAIAAVVLFGSECVDDTYTAVAFYATLVHSVVSLIVVTLVYSTMIVSKDVTTPATLYRYKIACLFEELPFDPDTYKIV